MYKIEHIFNEHKGNPNKEYIRSQEFDIEFIKNYDKTYSYLPNNIKNDYEKKYYEALQSSSDSIISKYDDEKINGLVESLGSDILMISGDFWGIQKFIFDGLTSTKASKILRSRSAMVQLITFVVADMIKQEFAKSDTVLFGAGKFLILAQAEANQAQKIAKLQKKIDTYFLQNFFGQNGFILATQQTTKDRLLNQKSEAMKQDLQLLAKDNERKKLNKFDFKTIDAAFVVSDIFANHDEKVCKFCQKRVKANNSNDACMICDNQIKLGEKLTKNNYLEISNSKKDESIVLFDGYYANFSNNKTSLKEKNCFNISSNKYDGVAKWSLNSYVPTDQGNIKTFEAIAKGSTGLMALKADVDKLGDTFREYYMSSFKKFNRLSRELDFFFSDYATNLIENDFKNCYVVFAGGDDLFLIGEYKEVVKFSKKLRKEFYRFSLQKATLSMGLVMFKPSTPINYISHMADKAEARAKAVSVNSKDRNGIDLFGISMKFDEFSFIEDEFLKIVNYLEEKKLDTTTFYYRLIELIDMRENINIDVRNAMWRSKLNYIIRRNIKKEDNDFNIFNKLYELIEKHGEKCKPSIFIKIYNNRDIKKQQGVTK